jgi:hypothetical protein
MRTGCLRCKKRFNLNANAVPGSAGISARDTPCARLVSFEHASRAKMPALPGTAGCVISITRLMLRDSQGLTLCQTSRSAGCQACFGGQTRAGAPLRAGCLRCKRRFNLNANAVPGSAGISARETPCARLVYFEHASRAKMPALPGKDGCVTSATRLMLRSP